MPTAAAFAVATGLSYLIGSLTFGLWIARAVRGIDIREHGSRNIGATNVGRVIGTMWGLVCLALDALKGLLPTLLLPQLLISEDFYRGHATVACGLATILGHVFPLYLRFRGGKGVATAAGVAGVICWQGFVAALLTFAAAVGLTRFVALGSTLAAIVYGVVTIIVTEAPFGPENWSKSAFAIAVPLLIVIRHVPNIRRMLSGTEARIGDRDKAETKGAAGET